MRRFHVAELRKMENGRVANLTISGSSVSVEPSGVPNHFPNSALTLTALLSGHKQSQSDGHHSTQLSSVENFF